MFRTRPELRAKYKHPPMAISDFISRLAAYYKLHGLGPTIRRAGVGVRRALNSNRMLVFYCDLTKLKASPASLPSPLKIERVRGHQELSQQDLEGLTNFWNPEQAHRNIKERFESQASLWLIKSEGQLAGYSWTIQGRTIAPYYFPMGQDDVQFFDWFVFPKFRGRAIHWFLITHILRGLAAEGVSRAFGDVALWNQASLSSYKMTPFRPLGCVRAFRVFGHTIVIWAETETGEQIVKSSERKANTVTSARANGD
jgi:hypothetical protein